MGTGDWRVQRFRVSGFEFRVSSFGFRRFRRSRRAPTWSAAAEAPSAYVGLVAGTPRGRRRRFGSAASVGVENFPEPAVHRPASGQQAAGSREPRNPGTRNQEPVTPTPPTLNPQPSTLNPQPSATSSQQAAAVSSRQRTPEPKNQEPPPPHQPSTPNPQPPTLPDTAEPRNPKNESQSSRFSAFCRP